MLLLILIGLMAQQVGMFQSALFTTVFVFSCMVKTIQIVFMFALVFTAQLND